MINCLQLSSNDFRNRIFSFNCFNDANLMAGGVYILIAMKHDKIIPVKRWFATDRDGILYIGKTKSFPKRLMALMAMSPYYRGKAHICGRRYRSNPNIEKKFPFKYLQVILIKNDEPTKLEKEWLTNYSKKFAEVPPLNAI